MGEGRVSVRKSWTWVSLFEMWVRAYKQEYSGRRFGGMRMSSKKPIVTGWQTSYGQQSASVGNNKVAYYSPTMPCSLWLLTLPTKASPM